MVRGAEIQEKHGLTRDGLLLFAMLCGGDFNPGGLKNCGAGLAVRAVRDGIGQGLSLCRTQDDCVEWRSEFSTWLSNQTKSRNVQVPRDFPDIQILKKYIKPTVYSDGELMNLRGLCERPINEPDLFAITGPFSNLWGKGYLEWIGPILLARWLVRRDPSLPRDNTHQIGLVNRRAANRAGQASQLLPSTLKCRSSPFGLTSLNKRQLEREWIGASTRDKTSFDANFVVEGEIPVYLLEKTLPSESFHYTPMTSRKRVRDEEHATAEKRSRTTAPAPRYAVAGFAALRSDYVDLGSDSEYDSPSLHQDLSRSELIDRILEPSDTADEAEQVRQAIALSLELPVDGHDHSTPHSPSQSRSVACENENDFRFSSTDMIRAARVDLFDPPRQTTSK
jgi:Holliday junction resolvase YEN1